MGSYQTIRYETGSGLAWITLNRPEKLNAINPRMIDELHAAVDEAEADGDIRVIVLKEEGRAFSAGFDLEPSAAASETGVAATRKELQDGFDIIMRFWNSPKPTISAVHGYCLGGAMEFAVACDITLAADDCRFGAPEVRFGSGIVALLYPWICGPKISKELLLVGSDKISALQAREWGLVNRVVAAHDLVEQARSLGHEIARNDQVAVQLTKLAINRSAEIAGMQQALLQALELDVIIEGTETDGSRKFNEILKSQGTRAAVAWRDRQIDQEESR